MLIPSKNYVIFIVTGGNLIRITTEIIDTLSERYKQPHIKLQQMVRRGELFKVVRGLYETDPGSPGELLASAIYGPSYLSFEYALSRHGLIPEAVHVFTSATFGKNKTKMYSTPFGNFMFQDIPSRVFSYGVVLENMDDRPFAMACPEKALCDRLYKEKPLQSVRTLQLCLFDELRIDTGDFNNLDKNLIMEIAPLYAKRNLLLLQKVVKK